MWTFFEYQGQRHLKTMDCHNRASSENACLIPNLAPLTLSSCGFHIHLVFWIFTSICEKNVSSLEKNPIPLDSFPFLFTVYWSLHLANLSITPRFQRGKCWSLATWVLQKGRGEVGKDDPWFFWWWWTWVYHSMFSLILPQVWIVNLLIPSSSKSFPPPSTNRTG